MELVGEVERATGAASSREGKPGRTANESAMRPGEVHGDQKATRKPNCIIRGA
jgi:hypothetical protein